MYKELIHHYSYYVKNRPEDTNTYLPLHLEVSAPFWADSDYLSLPLKNRLLLKLTEIDNLANNEQDFYI